MNVAPPIPCVWTGEVFAPFANFMRTAKHHYGEGEVVTLAPTEERSERSHRHYFATLHDLWLNLPEGESERFPTSEHLRKWCLIKAGFRDERSIVCSSKAEALRLAAFVRPMDGYAVVTTSEAVVRIWTAQSQAQRAMGKEVFQRSKDAVLEIAREMIGVAGEKSNES